MRNPSFLLRFGTLVLVLLLCACFAAIAPTSQALRSGPIPAKASAGLRGYGDWTIQSVYAPGANQSVGAMSIALEGPQTQGGMHISYVLVNWQGGNSSNWSYELMLATKNPQGAWQSAPVAEIGSYPESTKVLAPNGHPRIGILNSTGVYVFVEVGGEWVGSTVATGHLEQMTMTFDSNGVLRFYYAKNDAGVNTAYEAHQGQDGWTATPIFTAPTNWTHHWGPVALDSQNHVHTAIPTQEGIVHVSNASGTWKTEMVDLGSSATNIGVCVAGPPANSTVISYSDQKEKNTKVASNHSGTWQITLISEVSYGLSSALIDYSTFPDPLTIQNLRLAYFGEPDYHYFSLKTWSTDVETSGLMIGSFTIDESTGGSSMTAITADANARSYIVYYDLGDRLLKFATDSLPVPHWIYSVDLQAGYHSITLKWNWYDNSREYHALSFKIHKTWTHHAEGTRTEVITVKARYNPDPTTINGINGYSDVDYSYTDHGLRSDTRYIYTIAAVNEAGEGIQSTMQSAFPSGHLSALSIGFVVSLAAALILGAIVVYQNRGRIRNITAKKIAKKLTPQTYHPPKAYDKKEEWEVDEEELIDGHPKHLKKM